MSVKEDKIGSVCVRVMMVVLGVLLLTGCRPRNVLSIEKMEEMIYQLHRAEAILYTKGYTYGHDEVLNAYYSALLEQHGVTQAQWDSSLVWYTDHPLLFDKMYPKVLERLQTEMGNLNEKAEQIAQVADMKLNDKHNENAMPLRSLQDILRENREGPQPLYFLEK